MKNMSIAYTGGMQFLAGVRDHEVRIDLPACYNGEDTGPTPPELFIASLGSCIGIYVVNYLKAQELPCEGVGVSMAWEDVSSPARRIGSISANVELPEALSPEQKRMALKAAEQCMIHNTIYHRPEVIVSLE